MPATRKQYPESASGMEAARGSTSSASPQETDSVYVRQVMTELHRWQDKMQRRPSLFSRLSQGVQHRVNHLIPEKIHAAITLAIKQMVRSMLQGAQYTTRRPLQEVSFSEREKRARQRIKLYKKMAAAEGGITGAGGFLMSMADFPALLGIKMKLLYELAAVYGYDVKDYRERLYLLKIFQLAFSSQQQRNEVYRQVKDWQQYVLTLPEDIHAFDWRTFQMEYRDYLDLVKLAQMIPGIGALVGFTVNYRLVEQLGTTAMNAYRMRRIAEKHPG